MDKSVDSELASDIGRSIESEKQYQAYVQDKRESERESEAIDTQEVKEDVDQSDDTNPELNIPSNYARVKSVSFQEYNASFRLCLETRDGEQIADGVKAGLPTDTSSEWVRLCEWVDVDPELPAELRGELVPIKGHEVKKIDVPPVKKRLNPLAFYLKRTLSSGSSRVSQFINSHMAFRYVTAGILCMIPFLLTPGSMYMFLYGRHTAQTTDGIIAYSAGLFAALSIIFIMVSTVAMLWSTFYVISLLSSKGLPRIVSGLQRIYEFFFPSS